jgi:hypothetical protein
MPHDMDRISQRSPAGTGGSWPKQTVLLLLQAVIDTGARKGASAIPRARDLPAAAGLSRIDFLPEPAAEAAGIAAIAARATAATHDPASKRRRAVGSFVFMVEIPLLAVFGLVELELLRPGSPAPAQGAYVPASRRKPAALRALCSRFRIGRAYAKAPWKGAFERAWNLPRPTVEFSSEGGTALTPRAVFVRNVRSSRLATSSETLCKVHPVRFGWIPVKLTGDSRGRYGFGRRAYGVDQMDFRKPAEDQFCVECPRHPNGTRRSMACPTLQNLLRRADVLSQAGTMAQSPIGGSIAALSIDQGLLALLQDCLMKVLKQSGYDVLEPEGHLLSLEPLARG